MENQVMTIVSRSATDLVKQAKSTIENLTAHQVRDECLTGHVQLIDVREPEEFMQGKIAGAINAPRGMIEFYADASLPYHKPEFDKSRRIILYCASGGRSALAAQTLMTMGYPHVAHLDGGIKVWQAANFPVTLK